MRRLVLIMMLIGPAPGAPAVELEPGLWRLQLKHSVNGLPIGNRPVAFEQCLSRQRPIPTHYLQARRCDVIEQREKYAKLHWRISCFTEHGTLINEGVIKPEGRRLKGRAQSDLGEVRGRHTVLHYRLTGVWVGDCLNSSATKRPR